MNLTVQDEDVGMYKPEPEGQDSDGVQGSETIEYTTFSAEDKSRMVHCQKCSITSGHAKENRID